MKAGGQDIESLFRFFNEIGIIAQLSGNAFERVMPEGMTLPQFVVLNHLTRLGGNKTPLDLARAMQVTKGTMTNTLGHLERAGHVSIVPDSQDRRSKRVDITEEGRAARERAIWALAPELNEIGQSFSSQIVRELLPHLATLRAILDSRRAG